MPKLPDSPGVYLFIDELDNILYIGKAKSLRKRVASYFSSGNISLKVKILISKYSKIDFIVTNNEKEAFILENNLIKDKKPPFNILLKDDKTYPYVGITDEEYPRVLKIRPSSKIKLKLKFGPFVTGRKLDTFLDFINTYFKIRTCRNLSKKSCLRKGLNFCFAPCENDNRKTFYHNNIDEIIKILNGKNSEFIHMLNNEMKEKVENLDFEKAAYYRDILEVVRDFKQKQFVEIDNKNNFDVIGVSYNEQYICIVVNHYREGKFNSSEQFRFETIDTQDEICDFIFRYYERFCYRLKIFVSVELFENIYDIISLVNGKIVKSIKGQYASLVKLAEQNADKVLNDDLTFLISVKNKFNLENLPGRIECYDISNISGEFSVGVMTVFEMGQKAPHQYRKFKIKSVSGPDDFSSMREVIERRFSHKEWLYPDLVLVDGGKGQVSAVKEYIPDGIDLLGIAKKYEIILNKDFNEFFLNKDDRILKLMQNIRDETHRYAISFYRTKHGNFLKTGFEEIYGVGKKTVEKILKNYSSIDEMKNSGVDKLVKIVGKKQAEIIMKNINEKY